MVVLAAARGCCDMIGSKGLAFWVAFVLAAAGSAQAFQETVPAEVGPPSAPQVADPAQTADTGLGLDDDSEPGDSAVDNAGSSIAPNLDFGLELLYGGKSSAPVDAGPADDDTGLKGRLKHTF